MKLNFVVIAISCLACNSSPDIKKDVPIAQQANVEKVSPEILTEETFPAGERIDGPANIRDTIGGKVLFVLNHNTFVTATEPNNNWLQVGLFIDLKKADEGNLFLPKGTEILVNGQVVGEAVEDIYLHGGFQDNTGFKAELTGYTSIKNIIPNSIPEVALTNIIGENPGNMDISIFKQFLKDFKFEESDGLQPGIHDYQIDENWIDDLSPMLRLLLQFKDGQLAGIFHSRAMKLGGGKVFKVKRGFYFTSFIEDRAWNEEIIAAFNSFIIQVD